MEGLQGLFQEMSYQSHNLKEVSYLSHHLKRKKHFFQRKNLLCLHRREKKITATISNEIKIFYI